MAARARVFSGYRRLFRARKSLFTGDDLAMRESRVAIKSEFVKNKNVTTAGAHFEGLLGMVDEAVDMLRHGIARGDLNAETGNYEVKVKPEQTVGHEQTLYKPITEETVKQMEKPKEVEVTQSSSCKNNKS